VDVDDLSIEIKVFSIFYSIFGIPLMLLYLSQCAKAITSALPGLKNLILTSIVVLFLVAIVHDIVEQGSDDTVSFLVESILSTIVWLLFWGRNYKQNSQTWRIQIFSHSLTLCLQSIWVSYFHRLNNIYQILAMTTIGCEDDKDELPSILLYATGLFSLSVFSILFTSIQHEIERFISPYELGFTQQYAHLERALSGNRLEVLEEESDDEKSEWTWIVVVCVNKYLK
jgi:hypothetical protein